MTTGMWLLHLSNALCPADLNVSFWPNTVSQDENHPGGKVFQDITQITTQHNMATVKR
jgi:hypothetical protein